VAEEVEDFQPIDKLQQLGINAGKVAGILIVSDLVEARDTETCFLPHR